MVDQPRDWRAEISGVDGLPLTIAAAAAGLRSGEWTAVELLRRTQARAAALDPILNVFAATTDELSLAAARAADDDFAAGVDRGALQGVPLAIKDVIATADAPTRAQSKVLDPGFWHHADAPVVASLRAAGAVVAGKSVTMEYALGVADEAQGQSATRNPFDTSRWTGGTSTGAGAGIQAGLFLGGLGSDTGGSIRIPASFCGVTGLRPTYGTVPTAGVVPLAWTEDTVGPMARSARDCALLLSVISARHAAGPGTVGRTDAGLVEHLTRRVEQLRVGVDERLLDSQACAPDVAALTQDAIVVLRSLCAEVVAVTLPHYDELSTVGTLVMCAEALAYHRNDLHRRWADYGAGTRASLALGALTSSADYVQAQRVRRAGVQAATRLFDELDVVVTPTTLVDAPPLQGLDLGRIVAAITTLYWSAVGFPAVSIPMGLTSRGLPVGLQLAGPPHSESTLLRLADAYQRRTSHHLVEAPLITQRLAT